MAMSFRNLLPKAAYSGLLALAINLSAHSAPLNLQDVPLFLSAGVDPNVLINMSVETPMGGGAYTDQVGIPSGCGGRRTVDGNADVGTCYFPTTTYLGYFDPEKCYTYSSARFEPAGATGTNHTCSAQWSGNFLNWATMTAIDMFILNMTGGNRVTDTTSLTVIRRARKTNNDSWFPTKAIGSSVAGSVASDTVTPYNVDRLYIHNTDWGFNVGTGYSNTRSGSGGGFTAAFNSSVKVCHTAAGVLPEANCVAYGSSPVYYKPEGLIQKNSRSKRFGVLSYTLDNSNARNGGVLRSKMKYVGPTEPDGTNNTKKEYGTDGILITNPDGAAGLNSGVINYINKFSDAGYKSYDPISELFYEGVRYFKNLGPTPEYSSGLTTTQYGGFQIVSTWDDPITSRCQKNFTVAINDANPWLDKKLPGTAFTSATLIGAGGVSYTLDANDYGPPSNPDPAINVTTLTNRVGELEGLNGALWSNSGTWQATNADTGTVTASGTNDSVGGGAGTYDNSCSTKTPGNLGEVMGTCPYAPKQNSYYIAGLAYYANTTDLRADFANDRGIQNVQSFVIDTQEYSSNPLDGPKNMLWLAGKYGGFVDKGEDGAAGDGVPQTDEWDADHDGLPDNYVLATNPVNLIAGLNRAFGFIEQRTASAASASVNSGSISSETRVYQAKFGSSKWTGELLSFPVNDDGTLESDEWNAAEVLDATAAASRKIITRNADGTKVGFAWDNLDATRKLQIDPTYVSDAALGTARVNYLRGDSSNEGTNGYKFRSRTSKLGDIVSSSPIFVGSPRFGYRNNLEDEPYSAFQLEHSDPDGDGSEKGRKQAVYAGANDGMLHAFDAESGAELLAFIPGAVYDNLRTLSDPLYSHKFFVDGPPNMGDVFINDSWETVLVGGLNKGGQGTYALKITNPATFSEANAGNIILWEFTDTDGASSGITGDRDLGYTYSQPQIVRLRDGNWGAAFGNGYNNTAADSQPSLTGNAVLYIVKIEDGKLLAKIDTGVGMAQDPTGQGRPNGLSTPAVVDINGDVIADYVFAGDLFGNMWKFDISSADKTNWKVAYADGATPAPLFTATDATAADDEDFLAQPITTRPEIIRGPDGVGMMVLFGTGKYLEPGDKVVDADEPEVQSYYGVHDRNTGTGGDRMTRSELLRQSILAEVEVNSLDVRVTSKAALGSFKGWFMDLQSPVAGYQGERQVSNTRVRAGRVIFTTLIPDTDPCNFGGDSWIMELEALSGSRLDVTPIDRNNDGVFDNADMVTVTVNGVPITVPISGTRPNVGIVTDGGFLLNAEGNKDFRFNQGSAGDISITVGNPGEDFSGRQSWRQIR